MPQMPSSLTLRLKLKLGPDIAIGPGKADLLEHIREAGSIAAAGRRMGMNYRRAWLLVVTMNNASESPSSSPSAADRAAEPRASRPWARRCSPVSGISRPVASTSTPLRPRPIARFALSWAPAPSEHTALDAPGALPGADQRPPRKKKMAGPGLFSTRFDLPLWAAQRANESATERLKRVTAADRIMRREGEDRHRIRWLRRRWRGTLLDGPKTD